MTIKLGIVGTGAMAKSHAKNLAEIDGCKVVACSDVDEARAQTFAQEHGIDQGYGDYDQMLNEAGLDGVVNVTPDRFHAPLSIKALEKGIPVLCEKPIALNFEEAQAMVTAAQKHKAANLVNFSYRNGFGVQKARDVVQSGALGRILHMEASYLQSWLACNAWGELTESPALLWRLSKEHGSKGVLGDVGVHIVDLATYVAGDLAKLHCQLATYPKSCGTRFGEYNFDANDSAMINGELESGGLATIHTTRWANGYANSLRLRVWGETGCLVWDFDQPNEVQVCMGEKRHTTTWETLEAEPTPNNWQRFLKAVSEGSEEQPNFERGAQVQKVLDRCFESAESGGMMAV